MDKLTLITDLFHRTFRDEHNVILEGGYEEPVYIPATDTHPASIRFTRDYPRSALHEISHWCVAGVERRKLPDYGYWYRPDGRNAEEQKEFYGLEIQNQAIEKAFSGRLGIPFVVSADNLKGDPGDTESFSHAVDQQLEFYQKNGFPKRAQRFLDAIL